MNKNKTSQATNTKVNTSQQFNAELAEEQAAQTSSAANGSKTSQEQQFNSDRS